MASSKPKADTIQDGQLAYVSASQLKTYRLCPRKWYFEKVKKYPKKPAGKGAELGTQLHAQLETYLLTGKGELSPPAQAGLELLQPYLSRAPFNGGDLLVEQELTDPELSLSGVSVVGYIDLVAPPKSPKSTMHIIDHKFRADVEKYAETSEELLTDPQAVLYSLWAMKKFGVNIVEFSHHNHSTRRPFEATKVSVSMVGETPSFLSAVSGIEQTVTAMKRDACLSRPEQVKCNPEACSAFGGCDFANQCADSPNKRFMGLFEENRKENDMGFLDSLKTETSPVEQAAEGPKKASKKASITPPESKKAAPPPEPVKSAPSEPEPKANPLDTDIKFVVLADTCVTGGHARSLNSIVHSCAEELARENELSDIRLAPNSSPLAYGGWKVKLTQRFFEVFEPNSKEGEVLSISSGTLTDPIIEAFSGRDDTLLVRGVLK